jgi:hypothetical protein
LKFESLEQQ